MISMKLLPSANLRCLFKMSKMKHYQVKLNFCKCHPETCCCDPYNVVDRNETKVATFYRKEDAISLADKLNELTDKANKS